MKQEIIELLDSVSFTDSETIFNYGGYNEYYLADLNIFIKNKGEALDKLQGILKIDNTKLVKALTSAYGGRLSYNKGSFDYTAGQFYTLELPQAVNAVLDYYLSIK